MSSPDRLEVGQTFEQRYRIVGQLGKGGFAVVYEAVDSASGQPVAIKVLTPGRQGYEPTALRRFEREAEALERLGGSGVAALLGRGTSVDGAPYLVFELIRGRDLSDLLKQRGKLGPDETVAILHQLAAVLAAAHDAGVLHRDLKPENVRVLDERTLQVKLLDFGIARFADTAGPSLTATGELIGTPHYMSPEQLRGQPLTAASDVYSLGVLAFELMIGSDAMHGRAITAQLDRMADGYQFPEADIGGSGEGLLAVLRRMTTREPERRLQTAHAVLQALDNLERDPTIGAMPPERPMALPTVAAPAGTRASSLVPIVAVLVVAIVGLVALLFITSSAEEPVPIDKRRENPLVAGQSTPAPPAKIDASELEPPPPPKDAARTGPCVTGPLLSGRGDLFGSEKYPAFVPRSPVGEPMPLVIMLHGNYMDAGKWLDASGFVKLAEREGFAVVAPRDSDDAWDGDDRDHDIARLRRLREDVHEELCIDEERIFIVAQEQSGGLAYDLSCEPWLGGMALNAYSLSKLNMCEIPKPMMLMLPDDYGRTPPAGGPSCTEAVRLSFDEQEAAWVDRNQCESDAQTSEPPGATCREWKCAQAFRACRVEGGGDWPGAAPLRVSLKCASGAPPAFQHAEQIWGFFKGLPVGGSDSAD